MTRCRTVAFNKPYGILLCFTASSHTIVNTVFVEAEYD